MIKYLGSFTLLISIIVFASCTKPDIQWGQSILNVNSNTQLIMVDTFKPKILTAYVDSFVTSGKGIGLVGNYTDPAFGNIAAQSYFEMQAPPVSSNTGSNNTNPYYNTKYDSICLIIKPKKGSYYGDSTNLFHINVNRLTQLITPPVNTTSLYNLDTFSVDPTPLGSIDAMIRPNFTDSIVIKLSDALGTDLYNKLAYSKDTVWKSQTNFLNYLNGIRISGSPNNTMVIGYNDSVVMRLYYRRFGYYVTNETVNFTFSNSAHQFNHIGIDRTGTPLDGINRINREIPSETTNNNAYLQAITGSIVKITFPNLYTIQQLPNFAKIVSAKLIIRPNQNSYSFFTLPPQLRISVTNTAANDIGTDLVAATNGSSPSTQFGSLYIDYLYGVNTAYTYDLSSYIKSQLSTNAFYPGNHYGLLLSPPSGAFETAFNRAIIGDAQNLLGKIELQIIYATIQ